MNLVALFAAAQSRWHDALVSAVHGHDLPLYVQSAQPGPALAEAVAGLAPLGFAGAFVEDPAAQAGVFEAVARREAEAEEAGRVDAVKVQFGATTGSFLWPEAVRFATEQAGFTGARFLWVGPPLPGLRSALRTARTVHVWQASPSEGEAVLGRLPQPQRGRVALSQAQVEALAHEVDLILYAGGGLPLRVLQPYHGLFALKEPPLQDAYLAVDQVISPDYFLQVYLSRLMVWVAEVDLPPDAFALHGSHGS
ncbi:hypothetical protein [Oceanithermus desulfurans]